MKNPILEILISFKKERKFLNSIIIRIVMTRHSSNSSAKKKKTLEKAVIITKSSFILNKWSSAWTTWTRMKKIRIAQSTWILAKMVKLKKKLICRGQGHTKTSSQTT